jgi:hypothetical protein
VDPSAIPRKRRKSARVSSGVLGLCVINVNIT